MMLFQATGRADVWQKIKQRQQQMDIEDAHLARQAKAEEKKRKEAEAAPEQSPPPAAAGAAAEPPKKKGKVILAAAAAPKAHVAAATATAGKTRKHKGGARKIKVSMSSLSKKIHRAKTIRHKATEDTIAEVKKALHKAGLIKADSKAPEPILRQMYADFMTLKNKAL
jgi:hypothetical protein